MEKTMKKPDNLLKSLVFLWFSGHSKRRKEDGGQGGWRDGSGEGEKGWGGLKEEGEGR